MLRDIAGSEFSTLRWNFQEDVVKYASHGINKIGVSRDKVSDFGIEAAVDLLFEMKMSVSSVNWAGGFTGSDGRSFIDAVEDAKEAIELAGAVGADCLVLHSGGMNGHTDRHAYRIFEHAIESLLPVAEDYGVRLALEPMCDAASLPWSIFNQITPSLDLVNAYDSPYLGLVVDLFHCGFSLPLVSKIQAVADKVFLIQIADRLKQACPHRRLPGCGNVNLSYWLEALGTAGANCSVEFETFGVVNHSIDYMQRLAAFKRFASLRHLSPPQRTPAQIATESKIYKN